MVTSTQPRQPGYGAGANLWVRCASRSEASPQEGVDHRLSAQENYRAWCETGHARASPYNLRQLNQDQRETMDRTFVVVSGLPASGKTTLARRLADGLGLPLLDKDDILDRLFETELGTQHGVDVSAERAMSCWNAKPSLPTVRF
jgi:hypothetical protein